jgi:hypothetical protein
MSARSVVTALAVLSSSCGGLCLDSCRSGVGIPNGSGGAAITGGPALLYALYGTDGTQAGQQVALFHALVLKPEGTGPGYSGGSYTWECARATETFVWEQGPDSPRLELRYDGATKGLTIGGHTWSTGSANVFVISLNAGWHPTVRPLPLLMKGPSGPEVLKRIQETLPSDEAIRQLRVEAQSSETPQNNRMQLTRSAHRQRWRGPRS